MSAKNKKTRLIIIIELLIALIFIVGAEWTNRSIYILYQSYYADVFIPFGFYFLLSIKGNKNKYLNIWWKKSLAVFLLCATSESLQYFGVYALARVFDPMDYIAYASGSLLAALVDKEIFTKKISYWS